MDNISYPIIMLHLHRLRKSQKLSYSRLSTILNTPESTLKKWFSAQDGALSRINLLCGAMGTTLEDLLRTINQEQVKMIVMGQKQQNHFLHDWPSFEVYWMLVYERLSPAEIRVALNLSEADLRKHFLKLDRLNLIEFNIKESALVPKVVPVRWSCQGPFLQKLFRKWCQDLLESALLTTPDSNLNLQYFQISAESEKELRQELRNLQEKFARKTFHDMNVKGRDIKKLRFLSLLAAGSFLTPDVR